ncbi:hypothetical protein [Streptomyces griseus]|uniref:hypothetical protein n=1 Tax=Streptomyces griseus TaxID=1911 RepID=UPI00068F3B12|nr:hypothetical protein [Streptomyces griseus]
MTTPPSPHASDERVREVLDTANQWTRAALCTLARHGAALRRDDADRARHLLDTLAPWPPYKAGQFLFDLMEWEDFMLDGDPPPPLPLGEAIDTVGLPLTWLRTAAARVSDAFDGEWVAPAAPAAEDLPQLESGRYLYQDVTLGAWQACCLLLGAEPAAP